MNAYDNPWVVAPDFQPLSEAFLYASPERVDAMSFAWISGRSDRFHAETDTSERGQGDDHEPIN
jgi:hypothetical protein